MEFAMLKALGWRLACITPSDLVQPLLEANPAWRFQLDLQAAAAAAGEGGPAGQLARAHELGSQVRRKAMGVLIAAATGQCSWPCRLPT